ncbi:uncharacterized protein V2V93DRAFT_371094 [Kockiozyma suomiensis]|uniref:uncharacterized protein n=1 Tax=Kockiozyma suomiensis TaxID=1337062 RepID=UPI003342F17E
MVALTDFFLHDSFMDLADSGLETEEDYQFPFLEGALSALPDVFPDYDSIRSPDVAQAGDEGADVARQFAAAAYPSQIAPSDGSTQAQIQPVALVPAASGVSDIERAFNGALDDISEAAGGSSLKNPSNVSGEFETASAQASKSLEIERDAEAHPTSDSPVNGQRALRKHSRTEDLSASPPSAVGDESAVNSRGSKRRLHRKSRTGCRTCKKRRVKCDETHPRCSNCSHLGLTCSFQSAADMLENETAIATTGIGVKPKFSSINLAGQMQPIDVFQSTVDAVHSSALRHSSENYSYYPMNRLPAPGAGGLDLEDLRLMHLYSTVVSDSIARMLQNVQPIWSTSVPELAFTSEPLMHALLAFSSTYAKKQYKNTSAAAVAAENRSRGHRKESISLLKGALRRHLTSSEADKMLLTAYILTMDSIANAATATTAREHGLSTTMTTKQFLTSTPWVHLVRGVCCILKSIWPPKPASLASLLLSDEFYDLPVPRSRLDYNAFASDLRPFSIRKNFALSAEQYMNCKQYPPGRYYREQRKSVGHEWIYDDEDDMDDLYPVSGSSPFVITLFMLSKLKSVVVSGPKRVMTLIFFSLGLLDAKFYTKFHLDDSIAHRLIAEFYRVLRVFAKCNKDDIWWLSNLADGMDIELTTSESNVEARNLGDQQRG